MTKVSTIVVIHFGHGLPLATSEELLLLAIKLDATLVKLFKHLGGSLHHEIK
jgi:hypothetical protein